MTQTADPRSSAAVPLGTRIQAARQNAPDRPSWETIGMRIARLLPEPMWVTKETLRLYEAPTMSESRANPVIVAAIATALGMDALSLAPTMASEFEQLRGVLEPAQNRKVRDRVLTAA